MLGKGACWLNLPPGVVPFKSFLATGRGTKDGHPTFQAATQNFDMLTFRRLPPLVEWWACWARPPVSSGQAKCIRTGGLLFDFVPHANSSNRVLRHSSPLHPSSTPCALMVSAWFVFQHKVKDIWNVSRDSFLVCFMLGISSSSASLSVPSILCVFHEERFWELSETQELSHLLICHICWQLSK